MTKVVGFHEFFSMTKKNFIVYKVFVNYDLIVK